MLNSKTSGFTLIELLVVIFIIGIVTTVLLLYIDNDRQDRQASYTADELKSYLALAQEQATLQDTLLGLALSEHAYQFLQYNSANDTWAALPVDSIWHIQKISPREQFKLQVAGQPAALPSQLPAIPQISFSPSGEITPFMLDIHSGAQPKFWRITSSSSGNIILSQTG